MTQDIIEGNKLITEFMGWHYSKSGKTIRRNSYSSPYRIKDIQYDNSWDSLMPAIHKAIKIIDKKGYPHGVGGGIVPVADLYDLPIHTPIKTARNKLIAFIQWYNQQTV